MPESIFVDRRNDLNRRAREASDGGVSNGLLHCRRRARDRRQVTEEDSSLSWWLHVRYAAGDSPGWK